MGSPGEQPGLPPSSNSPATYDITPPYPLEPCEHRSSRATLASRLFTAFTVAVVAGSAMSIVTWIVDTPRPPQVELHSLSVRAFVISDKRIESAKWDAKIVIHNNNTRHHIRFEEIESFIFYDDSLISIAPLQMPFDILPSATDHRSIKFEANSDESGIIDLARGVMGVELFPRSILNAKVINKMVIEGNQTMSLGFDVGMLIKCSFTKSYFEPRRMAIQASCKKIRVIFNHHDPEGLGGESKIQPPLECAVKAII